VSELEKLQAGFQAYLMDDPSGAEFTRFIVDDEKVGVRKRLAIYFDAYRLRLIEALSAAYPKLKLLLGDDLFDTTARAYIRDHPSMYSNIRWYGDKLQLHLLFTLPQHPIAADMAHFEWALANAFDAEDVAELTLQELAEIPPENWGALQFSFQPALQIVPLHWNAVAVWKALDAEEIPPSPTSCDGYTSWLIWRSDLNPQFRSMDKTETSALQMAMRGDCFAEICMNLEAVLSSEAATLLAAQYLASWLELGLISDVRRTGTEVHI
jgi:hypothetical protein